MNRVIYSRSVPGRGAGFVLRRGLGGAPAHGAAAGQVGGSTGGKRWDCGKYTGMQGGGTVCGCSWKRGRKSGCLGGGLYQACAQCAAQEWCKASLEGIMRCRESGGVRVAGGGRRAQGAGHSSTVKHGGTTESQSIVALQRESSQLRRGEWVSRRGVGQRGRRAEEAGSTWNRSPVRLGGGARQTAAGSRPAAPPCQTGHSLARATHIG